MLLFFILFSFHFTYSWIPDLPTHWCMNRPTPRINKKSYWRNTHYFHCCSCEGEMCFYVIYTYNLFFQKNALTYISGYENSQCRHFVVSETLNLQYFSSLKPTYYCLLLFTCSFCCVLVFQKQNLKEQRARTHTNLEWWSGSRDSPPPQPSNK